MNQPMTNLPITSPSGQSLSETTTTTVKEYLQLLGDQDPTYLYRQVMDEVERPLLEVIMAHTNGNQSRTAAYLGINRATLRSKLKRHSLL
jgi:Fis family transcriptional regulator